MLRGDLPKPRGDLPKETICEKRHAAGHGVPNAGARRRGALQERRTEERRATEEGMPRGGAC
jgi:hypothetical protein